MDKNGLAFLGEGRIVLLEKIDEFGSISKAAESISMSYRKAWQLVKDMNEVAGQPLVEKQPGGKAGGGAVLTAEGKSTIAAFREVQLEISRFIDQKMENLEL